MPELALPNPEPASNPIDIVEEMVSANEWRCERLCDDELVAEIPGRWGDYQLHFSWRSDMCGLQLACAIDVRVPKHGRAAVNELLALANERLWLGHFDLSSAENVPLFRHAVPLRGLGGPSAEQLEDLVDIALSECERFYPAFQYVVWGGKSPAEAVLVACVDPVGEA